MINFVLLFSINVTFVRSSVAALFISLQLEKCQILKLTKGISLFEWMTYLWFYKPANIRMMILCALGDAKQSKQSSDIIATDFYRTKFAFVFWRFTPTVSQKVSNFKIIADTMWSKQSGDIIANKSLQDKLVRNDFTALLRFGLRK